MQQTSQFSLNCPTSRFFKHSFRLFVQLLDVLFLDWTFWFTRDLIEVPEAGSRQGLLAHRVQSTSINGKKGKVPMRKSRRSERRFIRFSPLAILGWICFFWGHVVALSLIPKLILLSMARVLPQALRICCCLQRHLTEGALVNHNDAIQKFVLS